MGGVQHDGYKGGHVAIAGTSPCSHPVFAMLVFT